MHELDKQELFFVLKILGMKKWYIVSRKTPCTFMTLSDIERCQFCEIACAIYVAFDFHFLPECNVKAAIRDAWYVQTPNWHNVLKREFKQLPML